jgi:SAM-dependent methyltransferase
MVELPSRSNCKGVISKWLPASSSKRIFSVGQNTCMTDQISDRADSWSRYWKKGADHSCAGSYAGAYDGAIATFWRDGFSAMPHAACILDLGTGNGPLPRILLDLQSRPDLQCDAVDLAEVAPAWFNQLPPAARSRVRFHSRCAMEQLPFEANSFELVVSQWGLEYSDLSASVVEILRVLAPGGRVQLLLHHAGALPVVLAGQELVHLHWLLQEQSFLDCVASMLEPMALAATSAGRARLMHDPRANRAKEAFNLQQDAIQARIDEGLCPDVMVDVRQMVGTLFSLAQQQGVAIAHGALQGLRGELEDSRLRLQELRMYAMNHASATALAVQLAQGGSYQLEVLRDKELIMGWALTVSPGA